MDDIEQFARPEFVTGHLKQNLESFADAVGYERDQLRWQEEKVRLIESVLDELHVHGALADVGCFTGAATARYSRHGFHSSVGFDASRTALNLARQRGIELWIAGEGPSPARDREFDVVIAADIIEHIIDTDALLAEIGRMLRPDGQAIITTPNLAFWISRVRLLLGRTPWSYPGTSPTVKRDLKIDLNHIRINTRKEWQNLFRHHGFEVEETRGWSILHAMGDGFGIRVRRWLIGG